jgi:hypothetical protein
MIFIKEQNKAQHNTRVIVCCDALKSAKLLFLMGACKNMQERGELE